MTNPEFVIVADIGGTNARFSRANLNDLSLDKIKVLPCAEFPTLADALKSYQEQENLQENLQDLKHVAIAIACPVASDEVSMTNFHWHFSISKMKKDLNLEHLEVINDFVAVSMSLSALKPEHLYKVGGGEVDETKIKGVIGAGTGLGVGHLLPYQGKSIVLPGEGGHASWSAQTEQEWFIQRYLHTKFGYVSAERILSGPGIRMMYSALAVYNNKNLPELRSSEIIARCLANSDELAVATIEQFFAALGTMAGNLALHLNTFGGVYIAGGITPRLLSLIDSSSFRSRFEDKGRFAEFNSKIATHVITAEQPGLLGATVYLKQSLEKLEK